ncbi:MAG: hypothetical protein AB7I68_03975 [Porticoccaceae bacterium]
MDEAFAYGSELCGTLTELAHWHHEWRFVFARVGQPGRVLKLNGHTRPVFGNLRLKRLDSPHIAADGTVCRFGSEELGLRWFGSEFERDWLLFAGGAGEIKWRLYF